MVKPHRLLHVLYTRLAYKIVKRRPREVHSGYLYIIKYIKKRQNEKQDYSICDDDVYCS